MCYGSEECRDNWDEQYLFIISNWFLKNIIATLKTIIYTLDIKERNLK